MNGKLVDTNILIYLSQKKLPLEKIANKDMKLYISVITYMEALGYPFKDQAEQQLMERICNVFEVIQLEQTIVDQVILIRRQHKIKLPDAIILATASSSKLDLVTANTSDFQNIDHTINLINPMV
ncbi:type II toxin-antitoxin system VapC family toxin [uncultured Sunxiuqinia sp.]|uniref:type II toxin-antitoxin system VapC family toxin n=1 Tax=uncultured Sunxiuqinia sp. TaxID=1573825 RepID=UPI0026246D91|nr:type II toxin-antitoxin system VapC family toxin [uncultured Sunxiuqinia sp.]